MPFVFPDTTVSKDYFTDNNASGGEGGSPFDFVKLDKGAVLKKIKAWKDNWLISGVEVWMSDGSNKLVGKRGGPSGEFTFRDGELIKKLNVQASAPYSSVLKRRRLGAIWLETDKERSWGIYAHSLTEDGSYWPDVGSGICCGIFGSAGDAVDRLGFAMLQPISRAVLTDVKYPNLDMEIVASTPTTVAHQVFSNGTDLDQTFELSGSRSVTITREWSLTTSLSMTISVEVTAGIPEVVSAKTGFSWTVSSLATHSVSTSNTETKTWRWPLVCPPHSRILGEATMYADDIDTEYEADMELQLKNGKTYRYHVNGVYNGLNARSGNVKLDNLGPYTGN
ncbi:aerolysin-like protein [Mya arenaria]|uniref:aerolysin-like protein n=1 Tax=Mya arenaria TaxID=6604 RepID=UPI0022E7F91A|nr:aerolysin-like protein [Mya arenaria]